MKLNVERKPESLVVFDITADDDEFAEAMVRAVRKVSRDVQVPGFRKGKAPRSMVERLYGRDVFLREAADDVMERLYRDALKQEDITPIGEPSVEIVELEPVNFVVTIPVYPAIELGDYSAVRVDPVDAAVSDEDIESVIERLQKAQSPWVESAADRKPAEGDQVTIDYEVMEGDQPFQEPVADAVFVLGETNLLTQLREKLEEMRVGDSETFELVFDDGDETADAAIRGKSLAYSVKLKALKERQMIELDDEFATKVAGAGSMDDLREQIRQDIHQGKTADGRTSVVNEIIGRMLESATIDPPQTMIDEETAHQLQRFKETLSRSNTPYEGYLRTQDTTEEDLKEELRPEAERRLKSSLLLAEVGKAERIEVTDGEIEGEIATLSTPPGHLDGEEAEAQMARMAQFYQSDYFRNMLRAELFERKLTDRLIEIATDGKGAVLNGWVPPEVADAPEVIGISSGEDAIADGAQADESSSATSSSTSAGNLPAEGEGSDWVAGDGTNEIPAGFTIKGNASSRIFHPEESASYDNTIAELYFANPEAAERAGFRLPKNLEKAGLAAAQEATDLSSAAANAIDDEK